MNKPLRISTSHLYEDKINNMGNAGMSLTAADYNGNGKADQAVMDQLSRRRAIWSSKYGYELFMPTY